MVDRDRIHALGKAVFFTIAVFVFSFSFFFSFFIVVFVC